MEYDLKTKYDRMGKSKFRPLVIIGAILGITFFVYLLVSIAVGLMVLNLY